MLVTFLHYCSTIIEKKNNQLIQIKEEQKGVLNFHETKERQRAKKRSKLDLWIEKKFTIASVSILLKYLFSRFDLFITMRILRAIKTKEGGGGL